MADVKKPAAQKKASAGFQGVRNAIWIICAMFVIAVCIYKFVLGDPANFVGGDPDGEVLNGNMLGTIYKGGVVVPVLITLILTVLCLSIERMLAQRTAFGKGTGKRTARRRVPECEHPLRQGAYSRRENHNYQHGIVAQRV